MIIEESIASSILHDQKDVIAKHLNEILETIRETYTKEDLAVTNEDSPLFGKSGVDVRLRYDKRNRGWSLYYGDKKSNEPWRNWVGGGFLCYDESDDLDDLAHELVERVIEDAVAEYSY